MDAKTCLAQFARLLADETGLLAVLETQLQQEHLLLSNNDVDGLEAASSARQNTVAKLLRIDDERRSLCRLMGQSADQFGIGRLLAWCDPAGSLAAAQGQCTIQAERCRQQNDRNGALVAARLNRITGMLDMLADNTGPRTYEAHGAARGAVASGRMLSISA
ncbi:MAG: flagellar protein FlgN [Steroidobacteraceae bacterium]